MDVEEALETVRIWHECDLPDCCAESPACALAAEVERMRPIVDAAAALMSRTTVEGDGDLRVALDRYGVEP